MIRSAKKAHSWILCVHQYPAFLTGSSTDRRLCKKRSFKAETPYVPSKTISRVMSLDNHLSRHHVTAMLKRPTWNVTGSHIVSIRSCFGWGLHMPSLLPERR